MELDKVHKLSFCGQTLNLEERSGLEVATAQRRAEEGLREVLFWGKVLGEESDYLVVFGLVPSEEDVPSKKFFFCTRSNYELQQLPRLSEAEQRMAARFTGRFKGDPGHVLEEYENKEEEEGEPRQFTEAHRLAFAVQEIDRSVSTVPRGAYLVDPLHRITRNRAFEGLSSAQATDLGNYFHFRDSVAPARVAEAAKRGLQSIDFLDTLADDVPRGAWAVQLNGSKTAVTLRSLQWLGYFFYHELDTPYFGGAYIGDGRPNTDLVFML